MKKPKGPELAPVTPIVRPEASIREVLEKVLAEHAAGRICSVGLAYTGPSGESGYAIAMGSGRIVTLLGEIDLLGATVRDILRERNGGKL